MLHWLADPPRYLPPQRTRLPGDRLQFRPPSSSPTTRPPRGLPATWGPADRIVRDSNWYQTRPRYLIYDLRRAEQGFDRTHDSYERYLATRFKRTADRVVVDSYHTNLCAYSRQASLLRQYLTYVPLDDHARRLLSAWNLQRLNIRRETSQF